MGKKKKKPKKKNTLPFVSVCTPTFNRRPFINSMIKCFEHQDYPKELIEWIIIDDGTDKVEELLTSIPQVKYYRYEEKMSLGKKRNLMHEKSKGEILVYMDDDDYYPPDRISHAVQMLQSHPNALCAGSSEIYIWFKHIQKMYQFGPYNANHATAGTFAFKRKLLDDHAYNDNAALAEEKEFLKNYSVPFVQLDPKKTILVFSHEHNTFDKRKLLDNPHPNFVKESSKTVDEFVKESDLKDFYMNQIENLLLDYAPGKSTMKPDVLQQIIEIEERRRKEAENMAQKLSQQQNNSIMLQQPNGQQLSLSPEQTVKILQDQQNKINQLGQELNETKQQCITLAVHSQDNTSVVKKKDRLITKLTELNNTLLKKIKTITIECSDIELIETEEIIENEKIIQIEKEKNIQSDSQISENLLLEINEKN
jgi:glycosyltransferase involved in cell wall biosynthesis